MKNLIKPLKLILILLFVGSITACSSDDDNDAFDASNEGEQPDISLIETDIILPEALTNSNDPKAQELVAEIEYTKLYEGYAGLTQVPPGAEVSHEPINPTGSYEKNATTSAVDYTVYTFSAQGMEIAYQFSVQNGMDVIEIFVSTPDTNGYVRYLEVKQSQDGKSGSLKLFAMGDEDYYATWDWEINSDGSIDVQAEFGGGELRYELHYNPDMSGNLKVYHENQLKAEFTWNANGSGTWINHATGESGSW